ncbi:MAG: 4Fe-4S dicluster domain-containing protein [Rhodoferax sp.]|uniref:4Fe-4S dicluster domain-containing protein n=1 Tax=Rhodoferax sp. TaxID=50421 RepID=UPI00260F2889|nr:4Fe-4S dicluster domain-containing protein [Rhodoferax sp.]MDD5334557.1 4Fe-4S dicluster domain-containing protein [Rhodoferax sp.]
MSHTLFQNALNASLLLCALGLLWRVSAWLRLRIGSDAQAVTPAQRLHALLRGAAAALFSRRVFQVLGALCLDVLLQRRLYRRDKPRWLAHLLMFAGFMLLLLMHALAAFVAVKLFPGYESTRNPYLFLRNLSGAMVVVGLALFLFGRWRRRTRFPPARGPLAAAFVALLGFVLVTGFLLEADKIASPQAFYRMAKEFNGSTDPAELMPLRALWASEFGVAFDDLKEPVAADVMRQGRAMHEADCATCHARAASAFVSYPVSRVLAPLAAVLDRGHAETWLLYLHVFACFIGLATLPITRFFHAVAAPVSLMVNGAAPGRAFSSAGRASRRALALEACVRCGICDAHCSVAPLARYLDNPYLLPSHKLIVTGALAGGRLQRAGREDESLRVAEGAFLCTDCGRCTSECPVGLDLEDLWQAGRADLTAAGLPAPAQWVRARPALAWAESLQSDSWPRSFFDPDASHAPLSANRSSFSRCVQCQTCSNVCPVVAHSTDPACGVDLTPQKVMNLLRLGLRDLTLGSSMVWSCASCYQCQEHCPEGIRVADIMLELRALAVQRLGTVRSRRALA